jgi:hypothetical protein
MKYSRKALIAFLVCSLCFVFITIPAYGYADPNTVGLISQIFTPPLLLALGAGVTFRRKYVGAALAGLSRRLRRRTDA